MKATAVSTEPVSPPAASASRRIASGGWSRGLLGILLVAALWEITARSVPALSGFMPPLTVAIPRLIRLLLVGSTWTALGQTALTWAVAMAVGTVLAVPTGLLIGRSVWLQRATKVVLEIFKPVPPVVFIPPMVLLFGTTQSMKIVLVSYAVFWPVLIQSIAGMESIDPVARQTVVVFRIRPVDRFRHFVLPAAWPYVITGLRIAASLALIATVVTELVGGANGIGEKIGVAQIENVNTDVFALVLLTGVLGLVVNRTFDRLERTTLEWHSGRS